MGCEGEDDVGWDGVRGEGRVRRWSEVWIRGCNGEGRL